MLANIINTQTINATLEAVKPYAVAVAKDVGRVTLVMAAAGASMVLAPIAFTGGMVAANVAMKGGEAVTDKVASLFRRKPEAAPVEQLTEEEIKHGLLTH